MKPASQRPYRALFENLRDCVAERCGSGLLQTRAATCQRSAAGPHSDVDRGRAGVDI